MGEKSIRSGSAALAAGATAFLLKPFTNHQLRNALRALVAGKIRPEEMDLLTPTRG